jgi:predicted nucleic acid-binding protein
VNRIVIPIRICCPLDSFAILAMLGGESGSDDVAALLRSAEAGELPLLMTWVNLGEVAYIVERGWGTERLYQVFGMLEATHVEFISVGRELTLTAAGIKAQTPLAYADAFAAALALGQAAELVTGDPEFESLQHEQPIKWIGS